MVPKLLRPRFFKIAHFAKEAGTRVRKGCIRKSAEVFIDRRWQRKLGLRWINAGKAPGIHYNWGNAWILCGCYQINNNWCPSESTFKTGTWKEIREETPTFNYVKVHKDETGGQYLWNRRLRHGKCVQWRVFIYIWKLLDGIIRQRKPVCLAGFHEGV